MEKLDVEAVRRATALLEAVAEDRVLLAQLSVEDRVALLTAVGRVAQPERTDDVRMARAVRKNRAREEKRARRDADRKAREDTGIREVRKAAVFVAPPQLPSGAPGPRRTLERPRNCYVCKAEYRALHHFYDMLCVDCGERNYQKRFQRAPLQGKVALITGGRVKIGYQASLMLLRSGARVIATTRFPLDAAERYAREPDFDAFRHRLHVYGLDLRHSPSVEVFARHLALTWDRLDILINNAAQTVRRPPGFYAHLQPGEARPVAALPPPQQALLEGHQACVAAVLPEGASALAPTWRSTDPALGLHHSAALSMVPYAWEQDGDAQTLFPQGKLDADLQQVDLRAVNSWRLALADVSLAEMLEVHLVNAVAPFVLCARLKPLMLKHREEPGHVVNVSAMEGIFSRGTKTDKHPHTNMAKAALNMLTVTSARDFVKDRIYMNAVDTGWVTDEDPAVHAERKAQELDFQPPLDIVDGAARVVDPVFSAVNGGPLHSGLFFKDYLPSPW